ncbi:MAG: helix-turn-helix transcriptional regulator, partial [Pseudomonadota bacterium]
MTKNAPLGSPATPDETYEHVGRKLREFRVARKMTQAQVAKIIEVSPQQYQKYEDAQSKCSLT